MGLLDRFTKRAKQVLSLAQEEARHFNHPYVGTEHILLGLIRDQEGVAGKVLDELGVKHAQARSAVEFIVGYGEGTGSGEDLELTASAKKVIEYALEEGRKLNHHYVGTEHLLLGLVRRGEGVAAGVFEILNVSMEQVRTAVLRELRQGPSGGVQAGQAGAVITPEQRAEIDRAREEIVRIRQELRAVQLELRRDIEGLESWLRAVNIALVPALLTLFAVFLGVVRARRRAAVRA